MSFLPVDVKFRLFHNNDHQDEVNFKKKKKIFAGGPGQGSIYLGITDRVVKTGVTREERSEEQTRETSWEYEWETAAARYDERCDFVSRDDGKMLDSGAKKA